MSSARWRQVTPGLNMLNLRASIHSNHKHAGESKRPIAERTPNSWETERPIDNILIEVAQEGVLVWCWKTNIYWGIYGDNHAHGTRKHFGKGLVTGRHDSRHTVFLVVCTANATSCYRHIR